MIELRVESHMLAYREVLGTSQRAMLRPAWGRKGP